MLLISHLFLYVMAYFLYFQATLIIKAPLRVLTKFMLPVGDPLKDSVGGEIQLSIH